MWAGPWLDPEWLAGASGVPRVAATVLLVALTLALIAAETRAPSVSIPRVLYAVGVATMVFGGLYTDRPSLFVAVWTAHHWLAPAALATLRAAPAVAVRDPLPEFFP